MRALLISATFFAVMCSVHPSRADGDQAPPPPPSDPATQTTDPPPATPAIDASERGVTSEAKPIEAPPPRPWRFTGTLGVVSLPRVLSLELLARYRKKDDPKWDLFAVGAGIEYLPPGLADFGDTTTLSWLQVGPEGRFFFFRWAFAGLRLGYQFVRADSEKFGSEVDYVTSSFFVTPKAGILYTFPNGLTIGGELGATIPIGASTSIESDGTQDSNARKVSKTFGQFVMPCMSLFRVGWTI